MSNSAFDPGAGDWGGLDVGAYHKDQRQAIHKRGRRMDAVLGLIMIPVGLLAILSGVLFARAHQPGGWLGGMGILSVIVGLVCMWSWLRGK